MVNSCIIELDYDEFKWLAASALTTERTSGDKCKIPNSLWNKLVEAEKKYKEQVRDNTPQVPEEKEKD